MAALRWSVRDDPATGLRLVAALAAYWWLSGRRGQAGEAAAALLATTSRPGSTRSTSAASCTRMPRARREHWARAGPIMRRAPGRCGTRSARRCGA